MVGEWAPLSEPGASHITKDDPLIGRPDPDHISTSFVERAGLPDPALAAACDALIRELPQPLPDGYTSELCLRVEPWIGGVGQCQLSALRHIFARQVGSASGCSP